MDMITKGLLGEFSANFEIAQMPEQEKFEQFATYLTIRRHYSETAFDPSEFVTGAGNDTGIDGIAIIANNNLITDVDQIGDLIEVNKYLDVAFVFVQADRGSNFEAAKIGTFGYGVRDFFGEGKLKRNESVQSAAEIMQVIFENSGRFTKGNPSCHLYYVTTGRWQDDEHLVARYTDQVNDLENTGNFRQVTFVPVGADLIQKLYNQSKNAITREFIFERRTVISDIADVREAHIGYMKANEFLKLICDEDGNLLSSLFYENVRDWYGYNQINSKIRDTLQSDKSDRFVLMNNGVTIVARTLHITGDKFTMSEYQVVNGCQTSNVLYDNRDLLNESVRIPLRIISSQDEGVMEAVITATNSQTEVKEDQLFALKDFSKKLEAYFKQFGDNLLYYERRAHQYDSQDIQKTRIITHQNLVRSVGAMFLAEPHRTTRTYRLLRAKVGREIFVDTDQLEPYYVAAFSLYKLEYLFRSKQIISTYKPARYQILLAARLLMDCDSLPPMNSREMSRRCQAMIQQLWHDADNILTNAVGVVQRAVGDNWERDHIRTQPITDAILGEFGLRGGGQ